MKKKFTILLLISLIVTLFRLRNDYVDITYMTYISSIGLNYNNENKEIEVYSYIINNFTLSKSDFNTSSDNTAATCLLSKGDSVEDAFFELINCFNISVDFSHLDSLVFNENFFFKDNLEQLILFMKDNPKFYPDYNVYITDNEIKDIYNIEHFNDISSYYTIITENKNDMEYHLTPFTHLVNDFYIDNYFCLYPSVKKKKNILSEENQGNALFLDGYYYFDNEELKKINYSDEPLLFLIYSINDITIKIDEIDYQIIKYNNYHFHFKKRLIIIYYLKTNYQHSLKKKIENYIKNSYYQGRDYFNVDYYGLNIDLLKIIAVEKNVLEK